MRAGAEARPYGFFRWDIVGEGLCPLPWGASQTVCRVGTPYKTARSPNACPVSCPFKPLLPMISSLRNNNYAQPARGGRFVNRPYGILSVDIVGAAIRCPMWGECRPGRYRIGPYATAISTFLLTPKQSPPPILASRHNNNYPQPTGGDIFYPLQGAANYAIIIIHHCGKEAQIHGKEGY